MSIRLKLALILVLAIAGATLAAAAIFSAVERRSLQASEEDKVRLLLDNVKTMCVESQLARDPLMLLDYLSYLDRDRPEIVRVRARVDGRWQGAEPPALPKDVPLRTENVVVPGGADRPEILVRVVLSQKVLDLRLLSVQKVMIRHLTRAAAVVLLLGVLVSIPLGWSLTRRLVEIERVMKEVGEGRLNQEIRASGSDEVAHLAHGLNAMIARLKELDEMKRTFVASVTHELRSPLFAIESYVKTLLHESKSLGEDERRQLLRVEANAARLAHFVTSLLDMARIERGQLEYRPRSAELSRLVEDAVEFQRSRAQESGLTLSFSADPGLPPITLDPDLINQVVTNLVSNAIKFTRRGGRIEVSVRRQGATVECGVADTGVGIPAETLARLFRPFERGSDPLRAGGTGLGLSIAKAIVERHGGRMGVESQPERGSRFFFSLPLADNKSLTPNPS